MVKTALDLLRGESANYRLALLDLAVIEALRQVPRAIVPDMTASFLPQRFHWGCRC